MITRVAELISYMELSLETERVTYLAISATWPPHWGYQRQECQLYKTLPPPSSKDPPRDFEENAVPAHPQDRPNSRYNRL